MEDMFATTDLDTGLGARSCGGGGKCVLSAASCPSFGRRRYTNIEVSRTFLGRGRITAQSRALNREIIFNPRDRGHFARLRQSAKCVSSCLIPAKGPVDAQETRASEGETTETGIATATVMETATAMGMATVDGRRR